MDPVGEAPEAPVVIAGFEAWAPELAREGTGYDPELFATMAQLEDQSFWFVSRNALITWALASHQPDLDSFFEIGCGTGYVLSAVAKRFPRASLTGSEIFVEGLIHAQQRVDRAELLQMDARRIPFTRRFDAIGAFDVLEHIAEDELVLDQMHRALKPGGLLVVSVPQHRWLWSAADVHAHHVRRYTGRELRQKIEAAGFEVVRSTSFVSLLLPVMLASRFRPGAEDREYDPAAEMRLPRWQNRVLGAVMSLERALIRRGVNFPCGGSRLVVARAVAPEHRGQP